jgi:hypothetical protein
LYNLLHFLDTDKLTDSADMINKGVIVGVIGDHFALISSFEASSATSVIGTPERTTLRGDRRVDSLKDLKALARATRRTVTKERPGLVHLQRPRRPFAPHDAIIGEHLVSESSHAYRPLLNLSTATRK